MKSPLAGRALSAVEVAESTQSLAAQIVKQGDEPTGAVLALHQTAGRGRLDHTWLSGPGDSLTVSLILWDYADHPKPWLLGMGAAIAVAGALHCKLQWPNDLLLEGRKLGGILTELATDPKGRRVPIVGIGANLNQTEFDAAIAERAISLALHRPGTSHVPQDILEKILNRWELVAEPDDWQALRTSWMVFDTTPGKKYKLADGSEAIGLGIGPEAELICSVEGETQSVMAAETLG